MRVISSCVLVLPAECECQKYTTVHTGILNFSLIIITILV